MAVEVSLCWALCPIAVVHYWLMSVLPNVISVCLSLWQLFTLCYLSSADRIQNSQKPFLYSAILVKRHCSQSTCPTDRRSQIWTPGCWSLRRRHPCALTLTHMSKGDIGHKSVAIWQHRRQYKYQLTCLRDVQPLFQPWADTTFHYDCRRAGCVPGLPTYPWAALQPSVLTGNGHLWATSGNSEMGVCGGECSLRSFPAVVLRGPQPGKLSGIQSFFQPL